MMRPTTRCLVLAMAVLAAVSARVSAQSMASQTQARWYDAYQEGVRAVQRNDWATAERLLLQAQISGPRPGRRVYAYGDTYINFLPDYHLGVVYLNTDRLQEAEAAFARVSEQGLITTRDPEYAAFNRQMREATFERAFGQAVDLSARGELDQASARLDEARATQFNDGKVTTLAKDIAAQRMKINTPTATLPGTGRTTLPSQPPPIVPPITEVGQATPSTTPISTKPGSSGAPYIPSGPTGPSPDALADASLRSGLGAFFAGDYRGAVSAMEGALQQRPAAAERIRALLACARVGLVLTGGADIALLEEARAEFRAADVARSLSADERRFISPRILQQLETP